VFGIGRVAREVEGAETLDRDDLALGKEPADRVDAIEQQDLLVATPHRPHGAFRNVGQRRGEKPAAFGAERERPGEAHAAFGAAAEPLPCRISVISGRGSCTAFFTPAWKVSAADVRSL
jgi:hypothetical protein